MLTSTQTIKIREFVKNQPVELVYLFGSRATGEVGPMSDYDFAVLFSEKFDSHERFELKLEIMGFLCHLLRTDAVDVVDLNSAPLRFKYEAIRHEGEIFVRSKPKMFDFEMKIIREFRDYLHYIKAHTKAGLSHIAKHGLS